MSLHPAKLTVDVRERVEQYPQGIDYLDLLTHFAQCVDRFRIKKTLENLRARGHLHSEHNGGLGGRWFPGPGKDFVHRVTPTDLKRIQRARALDTYQPMTFYGEGLVAPRAPSVWAYASSFSTQQERA